MRGKVNCSECGRWRPVTDFRPTQWLWGFVTRLGADCNSCHGSDGIDSLLLQVTSVPTQIVGITKKRYPYPPKPPTKAAVYGNKNRRHSETEEQFKARERARKQQQRLEAPG